MEIPRTTDPAAAGPLSHWLAPALVDWLHAKGCAGITLVPGDSGEGCEREVEWHDTPIRGWCVPLGDGLGSSVLLAFGDAEVLSPDELADVAALFERLHAFPLVPDGEDVVLVHHAEARRVIHDLRNGLNTLLINASLLARAAQTSAALARSAEFLDSAGASCADNLNRLSELMARSRGRDEPRLLG